MSAALSDFYDLVLPELTRCPESLAMLHIRLACEDFYKRSKLDRVDLAAFDTVADTASYALTLPTGKVVAEVLDVWLDSDYELTAIGPDDRDSLYPEWRSNTDQPEYYFMLDSLNLTLFATPDAVYSIDCHAALKPKSDATTIDSWVFEQYREQIAAGAMSRLMRMSKKPWSDPVMATDKKMTFEAAIESAKLTAERGRGRAHKRTRPVFGIK